MNVVEFILKLQDEMSTPMAKVVKNGAGANYTLDQLTEANEKLAKAVGKTSGSIGDLRNKMGKLKEMRDMIPPSAPKRLREVSEEINKLQKSMDKMEGKKMGGGMFSSITESIPPIFKNPFLLVGAGATALINQGMKNSQTKLDFELLIGKNSGDKMFEGLKKMKPLLGDDVFNFGKQFIDSGIAIDKVMPMLSSIGDVAAGSKEKLGTLTGAFSQLQKDGKLTEQAMSQMESGGFKPLVIMSQTTGISLKTLRNRLAEGKISINDVTKALQASTGPGGQFYGNLEKIAKSPMGGWNILIEKVSEFTSKLADYLMPVASVVIDYLIVGFDWLTSGLSTVVEWMEPLAKWAKQNADMLLLFGSVIGGVALGIKAVTVAKTIWATVTAGVTGAMELLNIVMMANPIGLVIGAIAGLVAGVVVAWNKFEGFRKAMYGVWETVKEVFTSIGNLFKQIFSPIGEAIAAFKDGRYMDAAKAAGKLVFNLSPVGIVKNVVEFSKGGGFNNVGGAYSKGAAKGAESWAKSQAEKAQKDKEGSAFGMTDAEKQKYLGSRDVKPGFNPSNGINAISGGGAKNISIVVQKMNDGGIHITNQNGSQQMMQDIEKKFLEMWVRVMASASAKS